MSLKFLATICLCVLISKIKSQGTHLEIVKKQLIVSTLDSQKVRLLNFLTENEADENIWPAYNDSMISLCKRSLAGSVNKKLTDYYKFYLGCGYNNKAVLIANNNLADAIMYYELSLHNLDPIKNDTLVLAVMCNLGETYQLAGMYKKASEIFGTVLAKSLKKEYKSGILSAYKFLASLSFRLKEYDKAKQSYFNCISICLKNNMEDDLGRVFNDLSHVCANLHQLDSAIFYYKKAYFLKLKTKQEASAIRSLVGMAIIYIQKEDYENAKQNLDIATAHSLKLNNKELDSYLKQAYARLFIQKKEYVKALSFSKQAWEISSKTNDLSLNLGNSALLYQAYAANNDGMKALKVYEIYSKLKDSLYNLEIKNLSNEMSVKNQYEIKSLIDSLKRKDEIKLSNYKLEQNQTQKYILFFVLFFITILGLIIFRRFKISVQQNKVIAKQKNEVDFKNKIIEEKQKEILDSIHYANKIQKALLTNKLIINKHFRESFIFFKPKDIVSGDFYWSTSFDNRYYLAVCDSTGHGVPGAFMCLLNIGFLNEAIKEKNISSPAEVFNYVRNRLIESIGIEGQKDGFDGVLLCLNKEDGCITYAASNNAPILFQNKVLTELAQDRMPVGKGESNNSFNNFTIHPLPGDILYLYTDGFADQFGGPKGKKFKRKELNRLLLMNINKPLSSQEDAICSVFHDWKGSLEQVDDVCVIGIKL